MSVLDGIVTDMADYQAAWVPELDGWDWDEAAELAVEWVERECAEQRTRGLLITMTRSSGDSVPALMRFAQRHDHTTPRSRSRPDRRRPVLVYVPDARALDFAAGIARGSSLCAVEGFSTPLGGWARDAGAVDLTGTAPAPAPLDPRLAEALDRLHFYGNNGWTRGFGQDQSRPILEQLRVDGLLDRHAITGAMLARNHSGKAVKRLGDLISKVHGTEAPNH